MLNITVSFLLDVTQFYHMTKTNSKILVSKGKEAMNLVNNLLAYYIKGLTKCQ